MAFTSNDDLNILQASDSQNIGAGAGNDTYIITPTTMAAGQTINITDIEGANSVKLVGGVTIESSKVAANSIQLTLNNGSIVNIFGADTFGYVLGGEAFDTNSGLSQTFTEFVEDSLGATVPTSGFVEGTTTGETIQDDGSIGTPATPTFALAADATGVDEGATATFTLTTTNVADGTTVNYTIAGVSRDDVTGGLTGTATVTGNTATISVPVVADTTTEGAETLTVSIDGQAGVSASTTVNDTSTTPVNTDPTFALAGPASVDEGGTATYTLTTTNVAAGTSVAYTITGVDAADVTGGSLTGTATVAADGTASIAVSLVEDSTTEGAETMTVSIDGQTGVTAATTVNDTSVLTTIPLTAGADTPTLTTGNDVIDGTTVVNSLNGDDSIVDSSTTDNDTLNVQLTNIIDKSDGTAGDQPTITNIENVNLDWNRVGNANVDLKNVSGSTVTVKSTNADFIGGLTVDNTGSTKVVAGDKVTSVTANDITTATIDTGSATSVKLVATVATTDAPTLIVNGNISVDNNTATGTVVEKLTVQATAASEVTIDEIGSELILTGEKDITLKTSAVGNSLGNETITDSTTAGTTTLKVSHNLTDATVDYSKAKVDLIDINRDQTGGTFTFTDSANVQLSANQTNVLVIQGKSATDALNLSTTSAVTSINSLTTSASLLESLLFTLNGNLTIDTLTANTTLTKFKGTGNLTIDGTGDFADASGERVVNATELDGKVTLTNADNDDSITIKTGAKDDTVTTGTSANGKTFTFEGNAGNDTLKLSAAPANSAKFVLDGGTGTDTLDLSSVAADVDFNAAPLTFNNFEKVKLDNNAVTFEASDISGSTLSFTGDTDGNNDVINVVGSSSADTIDLSTLVLDENVASVGVDANDGADTITGTSLADAITDVSDTASVDGGSGTDSVTFLGNVSKSNLVDSDLKNVENILLANTNISADLSVQSEGLNITGGTGNDTITGGAGNDTIASNGGTDSITGGDGIDVITGGGGTDTVVLSTSQTNADVIETFTSTTDKVKVTTTLLNVADNTITNSGDISASATVDAAIAVSATATQYIFSNAAFDLDLTSVTDGSSVTAAELAAITTAATTVLNATSMANLDTTFLSSETVLFVLDDTSDTSSAIFAFNNATATGNTIATGELVLLGVVDADAILANGDIIL